MGSSIAFTSTDVFKLLDSAKKRMRTQLEQSVLFHELKGWSSHTKSMQPWACQNYL